MAHLGLGAPTQPTASYTLIGATPASRRSQFRQRVVSGRRAGFGSNSVDQERRDPKKAASAMMSRSRIELATDLMASPVCVCRAPVRKSLS